MGKDELIQKIYQDLERDIVNGVYPIETKLPSERELALKYNATRIVIREAIAMLTKSRMVETRPQKGTFIRDFYHEASLDTLINTICVSNNVDVNIIKSIISFFISNDIQAIGRAAKVIDEDSLKRIEAQILRKKLHDDLQIQAECDFEIFYEMVRASKDPIIIALAVTLKPLRIMALKMIYDLFEDKKKIIEQIIESDIKLFRALSTHKPEEVMKAVKVKISYFENVIMKLEKIEDGKVHLS